MNSTWYSLAWKECHEHKWKLVSVTAILCGIGAANLTFSNHLDAISLSVAFVTLCIVPLSFFVGLGIAAGERSRRTLPFLQALPVPMWRIAIVKLAAGLITLGVSVGLTTAFLYTCAFVHQRIGSDLAASIRLFDKDSFTGHWYLDFMLFGAAVAASFFIWAAAAGVNRKDEISAGAVAAVVIICWGALLFAIFVFLLEPTLRNTPGNATFERLFRLMLSTLPGGFTLAVSRPIYLGEIHQREIITVSILTQLVIASFYVRNFGHLSNFAVRSLKPTVVTSSSTPWLGAPRRSAFAAIAWKQFRESGPIALTGIAASAGITLVTIVIDLQNQTKHSSEILGEVFPNMTVFLGFFVALVAGIGVCLNDISPSINTFWRSRPIHPDLWFWTKYATGLLVVLTSIYLPIGLLIAIHVPELANWNFPDAYLFPVVHLAVFSTAVAMTCLIRQAVYAAILSIAVVYIGTMVGIGVTLLAALLHLVPLDLSRWYDPNTAQIGFGLSLTFVVSSVVAWLATRYDWGKKSRY